MINSLQSLRFIFAIMIFLHHFVVNGKGLFEAGGTYGVSFFMILSGFVMSMGYEDKIMFSEFSYKEFIFKRVIRVYPLHLLCLFGFIVLNILQFLYPLISLRVVYSIYYWIPVSLLILLFALFDKSGGVISKILKHSVWVKMGEVSFSFYMIHILTFNYLNIIFYKANYDLIWYVKLLTYFLVVSVSSLLIYKYYERPMASFLKKRYL